MSAEAIAVVGMDCEFPGASGIGAFWELLAHGRDPIGPVPRSRWTPAAFLARGGTPEGLEAGPWGGFLAGIESFDAPFFGLSWEDAERMDPQQKLVLEVAWRALENAGIPARELSGTETGVFIGVSHGDHDTKRKGDPRSIDANLGVHCYHCFTANRLSYQLNLVGPSMAVDTACSSSLVAVHLACRSLRAGECDRALAGGVNVHLLPEETVSMGMMGLLSRDGRCRPFGAGTDGFARSEGCGIVVLERLSDAIARGDSILAVVRGSAVNHNGASNGITAPNGPSQARVIARALGDAGVRPGDVSHVEAHGTGTPVGDQVEVSALREALGGPRSAESPCVIGSVKSNLGHLEAAAGIASFIKVVLSIEHEAIPKVLHVERPDPKLGLEEGALRLAVAETPWPRASRPRVAGVSAFAYGGTNCHLVLEEPPLIQAAAKSVDRAAHVLALSAKSAEGLAALVEATAQVLAGGRPPALADLCHSFNAGRTPLPYRTAVVARSTADLRERLSSGVAAQRAARLAPKVGWVAGAGKGPVAAALEIAKVYPELAEALAPDLARGWSECAPGTSAPAVAALTAECFVLHALRSWGLRPAVVAALGARGAAFTEFAAGRVTLEQAVARLADRSAHVEAAPVNEGIDGYRRDAAAAGVVAFVVLDPAAAHDAAADGPKALVPLADAGSVWPSLLEVLGWLWSRGAPIDWRAFDRGFARRRVLVPNTPFQKRRNWFVPSNAPPEEAP